jgi:hypothetical protein
MPSESAHAVARYRRAGSAPVMIASSLDPSLCPLCGAPNECGMASGASKCWCFGAKIPSRVLDRLPEATSCTVCVCEACTTKLPEPVRTLKIER